MAYRDEYRSYERDSYWTAPKVVLWIAFMMVLGSGLGLVGCALGLFTGAATKCRRRGQEGVLPRRPAAKVRVVQGRRCRAGRQAG